jgi:hypothetical protein
LGINNSRIPKGQDHQRPKETEASTHLPLKVVLGENDQPSPSSWSEGSAYNQLSNNYSSPGSGISDTPTSSMWEPGPSPAFNPLENLHTYSHTNILTQNQDVSAPVPGDAYHSATNYARNTPPSNGVATFDTPLEFSFDDIGRPSKQLSSLQLEEAFRQLCASNTTPQPSQQQPNGAMSFDSAISMPSSSNNNYSSHSAPTTPVSSLASSRHRSMSNLGLAMPENMPLTFPTAAIPDFSPTNPPSLANLFSTYNSFAGNTLPLENFLDQIIRQLALYRARTAIVQGTSFEGGVFDTPY